MADIWGSLGEIIFYVQEAPTDFDFSEGTRYARHDLIGQKPTLQRVGEELQTINLDFKFHHGWCQPDSQLERLQEARFAAQPLSLILGRGRFQGFYLITRIDTGLELTTLDGQILSIDVSVRLVETTQLPEPITLSQAEPFEVRA